ncbi:MAG: hypothetical protein EPO24_04105 [Bacteroidetes bacterium]|nr:MAG: hypothetical protein EPO24_04105 [Bacteroidota bacterium]
MLIKLADIRTEGIAFVWAFDKKNRALYNLGGLELDSLQASPEMSEIMLMDGVPHQLGAGNAYAVKLMQTAYTDLQLWEGAHDDGATLWLMSQKETTVLKNTNYTVGYTNEHSRKKPGVIPLKWRSEGTKVSDYLWKMHGMFDPTSLILLVNPALQKYVGQTSIVDVSPYDRAVSMNGMAASAWNADKVSLDLDGVNDYLSIADTEFRGAELIGALDTNNRSFTSGIGNWVKQNANDTFASTTGGASGNGGKLTVGASAGATLLKLSDDIKNLVVGRSYHLHLSTKYQTAWNGGYVQFALGGASQRIVLTTSFQELQFDFIAASVNPEIVISSLSAPSSGDILWIDEVSLKESSESNLNLGERIVNANNRDFEQNTVGDWTGTGNHSVSTVADPYEGTYALKIVSSGAGSQAANYASLAATKFTTLVAGKKYTVELWAKRGDAGVNLNVGFGATGQTAAFTNLGSYAKCVFNFTAGANDAGASLRLWTNVSSPSNGMRVDKISITEAQDATIVAWVKKNGNPASADEAICGKWLESDSTFLMSFTNGDDKLSGLFRDTATSVTVTGTTTPITDNAWHLCVMTITRAGNVQLWVDSGVDNGAASAAAVGKLITASAVTMGSDGNSARYFAGKLGACMVKRGVVWSQQEVIDFYNSTKAVYGL